MSSKMMNCEEVVIDESLPALLDAIRALGSTLAVDRRLPEPAEVTDALQRPLSHCWADALPLLKNFSHDPVAAWKPVAERLASSMTT